MVKDHLGKEYKNITEMCKAWNIAVKTFYYRKRNNNSLRECLEGPFIKDHLGQEFKSISEMCEAWNIKLATFYARKKKGLSLAEILDYSEENNITTGIICKDHLGKEFKSLGDMCSYWGLSTSTYRKRIKDGYSIKDTLEGNTIRKKELKRKGEICVDHLGISYISKRDMCRHYGITYSAFTSRISTGMSLKDALTLPTTSTKKAITDHLGKEFESVKEMYTYWGLTEKVYQARKNNGWTLKRILETPIKAVKNKVIDHLGKEFESVKEMYTYWGLTRSIFYNRINAGWDLERALTAPLCFKPDYSHNCCIDHTGHKFKNYTEMCNFWNKSTKNVRNRLRAGWTLQDALTKDVRPIIRDFLHNIFFTLTDMLIHYNINEVTYRNRLKYGWKLEDILENGKYVEPVSSIDIKIKECTMTNQELFELTHSVSMDEKGRKIWTCKLCGKVVKKINENNLEETIARTNPGLYWCNNSTEEDGTCIGRLSSIAYDENPDISVPKIIYNHKKKKSGVAVYKFQCKTCGLVAPMTFEQIVEHKMEHINNRK